MQTFFLMFDNITLVIRQGNNFIRFLNVITHITSLFFNSRNAKLIRLKKFKSDELPSGAKVSNFRIWKRICCELQSAIPVSNSLRFESIIIIVQIQFDLTEPY